MSNTSDSDPFHEIQNKVCYISSSLQLIAKQHPEVTDFELWSAAMEELLDLSKYVHANMTRDDQNAKT